MSADLLVAIVYNLILYGSLACLAIPLVFFLLWTFLGFWKKHAWAFYCLSIVLLLGIPLIFYLAQHYWIYWYYAFPVWAQIFGLVFIVFAYMVVKIAQASIGIAVRYFYPILKGRNFHLKTNGLYKFVRHPMYAIFPWMILGALLYTGQLILLVVLAVTLLTRNWYASKEEDYLRKNEIYDYEQYMKQTPNRFYPKFF